MKKTLFSILLIASVFVVKAEVIPVITAPGSNTSFVSMENQFSDSLWSKVRPADLDYAHKVWALNRTYLLRAKDKATQQQMHLSDSISAAQEQQIKDQYADNLKKTYVNQMWSEGYSCDGDLNDWKKLYRTRFDLFGVQQSCDNAAYNDWYAAQDKVISFIEAYKQMKK